MARVDQQIKKAASHRSLKKIAFAALWLTCMSFYAYNVNTAEAVENILLHVQLWGLLDMAN